MVVYEALTTAGSRPNNNNRIAVRLWEWLLVGPRHLIQSFLLVQQQQHQTFADYGCNERSAVLRRVALSWVASGGLGWFVVALIVAAARQQRRRPNSDDDTTVPAAKVAAAWLQSIVTAWRTRLAPPQPTLPHNDNNNNINPGIQTLHQGSCQCGAVQFQVSVYSF